MFVELSLPSGKYADAARHGQFLEEAMAQLEMMPEIAAATPVNVAPFSGDGGWDVPKFTAEGQSADRAAANPSLNLESIYPNYFRTFGIPLVRGTRVHGRRIEPAPSGGHRQRRRGRGLHVAGRGSPSGNASRWAVRNRETRG